MKEDSNAVDVSSITYKASISLFFLTRVTREKDAKARKRKNDFRKYGLLNQKGGSAAPVSSIVRGDDGGAKLDPAIAPGAEGGKDSAGQAVMAAVPREIPLRLVAAHDGHRHFERSPPLPFASLTLVLLRDVLVVPTSVPLSSRFSL